MISLKENINNKRYTTIKVLQYITKPVSLIYLTTLINILVIQYTPPTLRFTQHSYINSLLWSANIMYFLYFLKLYLIYRPQPQPQVIQKTFIQIFIERINQIAQNSHAWPIFLYSFFLFPIILISLFIFASIFPNAILIPTVLLGILIFLIFLILFLFIYFLFRLLWIALGLVEIVVDL